MNRKGLSTDPGRAGGPVRSSGEAPAGRGGGGAKGPGCLWLASLGQPDGVREELDGQAEIVGKAVRGLQA
jgi:hypothetical protein